MINKQKTSNILHGSGALPDWIYYQLNDEIPPNVALDRQHQRIIRELEERERMAQFKKREDDLKKKEQELNKREKEL